MSDPLDNYPADVMEPIADQIVEAFVQDDADHFLSAIATAQADGGHGWITSLIFALAGRAAGVELDEPDTFVEDYTAMRKAGLPHHEIARIIGVVEDSLNQRIRRHDCRIPEEGERMIYAHLAKMIERGRAFTIEDFPFTVNARSAAMVLRYAERDGVIVRAGRARSLSGQSARVVRFVPAARVDPAEAVSA